MDIQYYNIDFVKQLGTTIKDGLPSDIKEKLLHIKTKNCFNIYNSNNAETINTNKQTTPYNHTNIQNPQNPQNPQNTWRNNTTLVTRKVINPNENSKKKELFLLLNKLSESNFQIISKQIITLVNDCEASGDTVFVTLIERLFKSAMIQVSFCPIYAKICVDLISELDSSDVYTALQEKITLQLNSLKEFSSSMELSDYENFCKDVAFKNRYIGCYQFITELLNNKCLPFSKMIEVLNDLSSNINEEENSIKIDILVESICKIYQSINRTMLNKIQVDEINEIISNILKEYKDKMSSRSKFIFEDVLEGVY